MSVPDPGFLDALERTPKPMPESPKADAFDFSEISRSAEPAEPVEFAEFAEPVESAEPAPVVATEAPASLPFEETPAYEVTQMFPREYVMDQTATQQIPVQGYRMPESAWEVGETLQIPRIDLDDPEARGNSRSFRNSNSIAKRRGAKPFAVGALAVILVAGVVAGSTYAMELWGGKSIPAVKGMTQADAAYKLEGAGFNVKSDFVYSDETEGLVLLTDPAEASRLDPGQTVLIHIAQARTVPDVENSSVDDARAKLAEVGCVNIDVEEIPSDTQKNTVLSVQPLAGTKVKASDPIVMKVAVPFKVPDVAGKTADAAANAVIGAGLSYVVEYVNDETAPDGSVLGCYPAVGSEVTSDTVVALQVVRHRAGELEAATFALAGSTLPINGVSCVVNNVSSAKYLGDDVTAFTMTVTPFVYFFNMTMQGDPTDVSGTISWSEDNQVISVVTG